MRFTKEMRLKRNFGLKSLPAELNKFEKDGVPDTTFKYNHIDTCFLSLLF